MNKIFFVCLLLVMMCVPGCDSFAGEKADANVAKASSVLTVKKDITEAEQALQRVLYSYYMRGRAVQYNSLKRGVFPPEEATGQNTNYMVCSALPQNLYKELSDINIPPYTQSLLKYTREHMGWPEVIAYGKKNALGNLIMQLQEIKDSNQYVTLTNPHLKDILPLLRCGDIMTYNGHVVVVYELLCDNAGNVVDAYVMQSGHGNKNFHVNSKIPKKLTAGKDIKFGSANHYLYHNNRVRTIDGVSAEEGSFSIVLLSGEIGWGNIDTDAKRKEYSVLRFLQNNNVGELVLNYQGAEYKDKNYNNEKITLPDTVKDRLKFDRLYIEKTVNAHADDVVEADDVLTYTVTVKNNSAQKYEHDIKVKEILSDHVLFKNQKTGKNPVSFVQTADGKNLEWNLGRLAAGETVTVSYSVSVKDHCEGKVVESRGRVEHIPSAVVKNVIGRNLTKQQELALKDSFAELKTRFRGKALINEMYKKATGVDLQFEIFTVTDLVQNTNRPSKSSSGLALNKEHRFYGMVLNKYWSALSERKYSFKTKNDITAYDLKAWGSYSSPDRRADTVYSENFKTGDILIYKNSNDVIYKNENGNIIKTNVTYENGEYAYIFIEGNGFVGVNYGADGTPGTQDDRNTFDATYYRDKGLQLYSDPEEKDEKLLEFFNYQTLFGKDCYVILRPSLGLAHNI